MPNSKRPYWLDSQLYPLWIYTNGARLTGKDFLNFSDLTSSQGWNVSATNFLIDTLKTLNIHEIEGIIFNKESYLFFHKSDHEKLLAHLNTPPLKERNIAWKKSLDNIFNNKFELSDIENMLAVIPSAVSNFGFNPNLTLKTKKTFMNYLNKYLDDFVGDRLAVSDQNYWKFEKQKEMTLKPLINKFESFGDTFIIKYLPSNYSPNYLFIHSIASLEKLGYFTIEQIWIDEDVHPDDQTPDYKVRMTLKRKFHDEYDPSFKISNAKKSSPILNKDNAKTLFLDGIGDLWREPKNKYCYPMIQERERQKILRYFVTNHSSQKFIPTKNAAFDLNKKTQYLRSEIGKINTAAENSLKLKLKLIESKQGSGYRLNPNIKIQILTS